MPVPRRVNIAVEMDWNSWSCLYNGSIVNLGTVTMTFDSNKEQWYVQLESTCLAAVSYRSARNGTNFTIRKYFDWNHFRWSHGKEAKSNVSSSTTWDMATLKIIDQKKISHKIKYHQTDVHIVSLKSGCLYSVNQSIPRWFTKGAYINVSLNQWHELTEPVL